MKKMIASAKFTAHSLNYALHIVLLGVLYVASAIESVIRFLYRFLPVVLSVILIFVGIRMEYGYPLINGFVFAFTTAYGLRLIAITILMGVMLGCAIKFLNRKMRGVSKSDDSSFTFFSMKLYYCHERLKYIKDVLIPNDVDGMTYGDEKAKQAELRRNEVEEMERFKKQLEERGN